MALDDLRRLGAKLECWQKSPAGDFETSERRGRLEGSRPRTRLGSPGIKLMAGKLQAQTPNAQAGSFCIKEVRSEEVEYGRRDGAAYFNLPQQRHDLLRFVFLHWHVQLSFRVIFSHSRWTKSTGSGQALAGISLA